MNHRLFVTGSVLMALAVVLGAMGAHALEQKLEPAQLDSFETGVRYHLYHALALLIVAAVYERFRYPRIRVGVQFLLVGLLFFSGSIYTLTIGYLADSALAAYVWWITPTGGLLLIAGWLIVATAAWPRKIAIPKT